MIGDRVRTPLQAFATVRGRLLSRGLPRYGHPFVLVALIVFRTMPFARGPYRARQAPRLSDRGLVLVINQLIAWAEVTCQRDAEGDRVASALVLEAGG
jgi:hypothetical protein